MGRFTGFLGLAVILGAAWLFSTHKKAIKLRIIAWGMGLQIFFALLVLKTDFGRIFQWIGSGVNSMLDYAEKGSEFLFGPLGVKGGPYGVIFAFQVLPIVIFIASFFAILYYLGVMQWIVRAMAVAMQKVMGVSGAESLNVAASIFMGQTEAPLTIKPFIAGLTESELFTIMTSGMAHVSGAVMAAYVKIAGVSITHLLTAVIMTAPATIMLSKIFIPETGKPATAGKVEVKVEKTAVNVIDAAAQGAGDGLHLALNIGGMLIAFLALIAMGNGIMGWLHTLPGMGWVPQSLEQLFGLIFAPVAFVMGVPWKDAHAIGDLLGTRLVLNEFVAFLKLGPMKDSLDPRSFVIATYALCGFANFSSIAIQIGGIGALAPNRKSDLARLGLRAVAAGSMANFMSACIAGMLL
jgi:concentrative nucleoside transporter, CNT family